MKKRPTARGPVQWTKLLADQVCYRLACLQEVWQPGYSAAYRWYRFRSAVWRDPG